MWDRLFACRVETSSVLAFTNQGGDGTGFELAGNSLQVSRQARTSVRAFHGEARHCQGRNEEFSADGMLRPGFHPHSFDVAWDAVLYEVRSSPDFSS